MYTQCHLQQHLEYSELLVKTGWKFRDVYARGLVHRLDEHLTNSMRPTAGVVILIPLMGN